LREPPSAARQFTACHSGLSDKFPTADAAPQPVGDPPGIRIINLDFAFQRTPNHTGRQPQLSMRVRRLCPARL